MKDIVRCFLFSSAFFLSFLIGVCFGSLFRFSSFHHTASAASFVPDRRELKCTCVPCLPDMFCLKCGHKSRDCPKLAHIFKKATNALSAVSAPVK